MKYDEAFYTALNGATSYSEFVMRLDLGGIDYPRDAEHMLSVLIGLYYGADAWCSPPGKWGEPGQYDASKECIQQVIFSLLSATYGIPLEELEPHKLDTFHSLRKWCVMQQKKRAKEKVDDGR